MMDKLNLNFEIKAKFRFAPVHKHHVTITYRESERTEPRINLRTTETTPAVFLRSVTAG
jgi:hypothetical protein